MFYGRHSDLVNRYGISVSQMTMNMFHLSLALLTFMTCHQVLYENPSFIIFSAETKYISTRSWYRNINFLRDRIMRIFICDVQVFLTFTFTEYGTVLTTILPILFLYLNTVIVTTGALEP
jgi:hypothetical protein